MFMVYLWIRSIRYSPKLNEQDGISLLTKPDVSIILPARNEEKGIGKCLESLLNQDYPKFELIVINDRSTDKTLEIMNQVCLNDNRVKLINIQSSPVGWVGKNWATFQGYLKSSGSLLLFSDADTYHNRNTIKVCVEYFVKNKLDALNLLPKISTPDFFTKLVAPVYSLDRHTFCSPVDTNDPEKKAAYFNGVYYLIKREVYQKIGTHESYRDKYSEDIFIGRTLKELKFKMKRVRGELYLSSDTIRSVRYLFNQISRITYRYYQESKLGAIKNTIALLLLNFSPMALLLYSIIVTRIKDPSLFPETVLPVLSLVTLLIMVGLCCLQSKYGLYQNILYGFGAPVAGCVFSLAYVVGLFRAIRRLPIKWREGA